MKIRTACLDSNQVWIIDDIIGGLYVIDLETLKTKCIVNSWQLFQYGKFEPQSIITWKDEYILIIPREINRHWVFYNKITKKIEYRKIIEEEYKEILIAIDQDRKQFYFCPMCIDDPILIIDFDTLICSQVIANWNNKALCSSDVIAWKGAYNGKYVFFSIKNTKILVRINCETHRVELLELNISEKIIDIDYAFEELWILPVSGNKVYQIDENGKIVNIVKLLMDGSEDSIPNFIRIIVQKKYLFFFPCYESGIYVYEKSKKNIQILANEDLNLKKKSENHNVKYWAYYIKDNQLNILPLLDKFIEVDLDTLKYKKKDLLYPTLWPDKENMWKSIWNHVFGTNRLLVEVDSYALESFFDYILYKLNNLDVSKVEYIGEKIWMKI